MYKKKKGFTIVELIVVMAIIAILVIMAVPKLQKYIEKAKLVSILATADTIHDAAIAYEAANITDPNLLNIRKMGYMVDFHAPPQYIDGTYVAVSESYLSPYVNGDVLFMPSYQTDLLNDTDVYNVFYVGELPFVLTDLTSPIVVFYNDPRLPTKMRLYNDGMLGEFQYTSTGVLDGVPMVFGASNVNGASNDNLRMLTVTDYLEKYNKALKEKNK